MSDDDLISAFFDGELTPEEQELAAQKLQSDPELQRERDEIARVSAALKKLTQTDAPPELLTSIRQRVEREALLGSLPKPQPPRSTQQSKGTAFRNWKTVLVSSVCLLLALITVPWLFLPSPEAEQIAQLEPVSEAISLEFDNDNQSMSRFSVSERAESFNGNIEGQLNNLDSIKPAVPAESDLALKSVDAKRQFQSTITNTVPEPELPNLNEPSDAALDKLAAPQVMERSRRLATSAGTELQLKESLAELNPGSTIEAQEINGDEVSVVRLTVVDRVASLRDFQILLQKHDITAEESSTAQGENTDGLSPADDLTSSFFGEQGGQQPGLIAVYVSAPPEQIDAALTEMRQSDFLADNHFNIESKLSTDSLQTELAQIDLQIAPASKDLPAEPSPDFDFGVLSKRRESVVEESEAVPAPVERSKFAKKVKSTSQTVPPKGYQMTFEIPEQQLAKLIKPQVDFGRTGKALLAEERNSGVSNVPAAQPSEEKQKQTFFDFSRKQISEKQKSGRAGAAGAKPDSSGNNDRYLYADPQRPRLAQVLFIIQLREARAPVPAEKPAEGDSSFFNWPWEKQPLFSRQQIPG